jgi:hypothetical protein
MTVAAISGFVLAGASEASARVRPPKPVPAWYMTATNVTDLIRQAKHNACAFARQQPKSSRLMLFDFGAARKYRDGTFGANLRKIKRFRNSGILKALKKAARKYNSCHRKGSATIAYGNTNSMPRYMSKEDAFEAGLHQTATIRRLRKFQHRQHDYDHESAATAGDIEPGWGQPGVTKALVRGANGATRYYNFGNAGGCPGQPGASGCHNGWSLADLGEVSVGRKSRPLPEVYRPYEAVQWAKIQRRWGGKFRFAGVTGSPIEPLSPAESWMALKRKAHHVGRELVSIRNSAPSKRAAAREPRDDSPAGTASLGGPMTGATPAHVEPRPDGFFSTSQIYPLRNEWVVSDHRRFVAVDAGADPVDPSTGVIGIFRQNYIDVMQRQQLVRVPGAGALKIARAPTGGTRAALSKRGGPILRFTGERGVSGTIDVRDATVEVSEGR